MGKHTPGPWEWETFKAPDLPQLRSPDGIICDFGCEQAYYPVEGTPPNEADARLIAAAPELLEACKFAIEAMKDNELNQDDSVFVMLRDAIAKAEGSANG